jgi:membrane protein implicated in regulation of membrane protease activity
MALTVAVLLALFVLPWPLNLVAVVAGVGVEAAELTWGLRLARRWRPQTGAEAMIGQTAEVVVACRPHGHARIAGELWEAWCDEGADVGDRVRIERLEGLTLIVTQTA